MKTALNTKIICALAAICLLLGLFGCSGADSTVIAEGKTGELRWVLEDNGCLSFTGNGAIPGVEYTFNTGTGLTDTVYPAWYEHRDSITEVIIGSGIDSVSMNAFMYFPSLTRIDFAATVSRIDGYAVTGCDSLRRVIVRCPAVEMEKFCIGYTGGTADGNLADVVFEGVPGSQTESYAKGCGARFSKL